MRAQLFVPQVSPWNVGKVWGEEDDLKNQVQVIGDVCQNYLQKQFNSEKINFASIGNIVSQLHIHIIGRHSKDPCWPDVVWGQSYPVSNYSESKISLIKQDLEKQLNR